LTDAGYLLKRNHTYKISVEFLRLGTIARQSDLHEGAVEELDNLVTDPAYRANLGILEGGDLCLVRTSEGGNAHVEGKSHQMYASGLGKAMLAHMSEDRVSRILDQHGMRD